MFVMCGYCLDESWRAALEGGLGFDVYASLPHSVLLAHFTSHGRTDTKKWHMIQVIGEARYEH